MRRRRVEGPGASGAAVEEVADALSRGELLVHPTFALYGLGGAPAAETDAEVARLKGRPAERSFLRLAGSIEAVRAARPSPRWDARARRLAERLWPGAVTAVLDDGTEHGLAVRLEPHPLTRAVLRRFGGLLTSTSLNRSGEPPPRTHEAVRWTLDGLPEARVPVWWLDAGAPGGALPSTLVDLRGPRPRLLRAGAVPAEAVGRALGEPVERGVPADGAEAPEDGAPARREGAESGFPGEDAR